MAVIPQASVDRIVCVLGADINTAWMIEDVRTVSGLEMVQLAKKDERGA